MIRPDPPMTVCAPILIALLLLAGVWLLVVFSNPTDQRTKSWLGLLGVPYGLLLLAGFFLVSNRIGSAARGSPGWIEPPKWGLGAPAVRYRAAGGLPVGHLLRAADLAPPPGLPSGLRGRLPPASSLAGKYLEQEVSAGAPIPLELLDDEPPAAGPAGVASRTGRRSSFTRRRPTSSGASPARRRIAVSPGPP